MSGGKKKLVTPKRKLAGKAPAGYPAKTLRNKSSLYDGAFIAGSAFLLYFSWGYFTALFLAPCSPTAPTHLLIGSTSSIRVVLSTFIVTNSWITCFFIEVCISSFFFFFHKRNFTTIDWKIQFHIIEPDAFVSLRISQVSFRNVNFNRTV